MNNNIYTSTLTLILFLNPIWFTQNHNLEFPMKKEDEDKMLVIRGNKKKETIGYLISIKL